MLPKHEYIKNLNI